MSKRILFGVMLMLWHGGTWPDTTGVAVRDTELKADPEATSETLRSVPSGTTVALGERRGGWYQASVDDDAGWLRMLAVRLSADARAPGTAGIGALLQVGRSEATVSTGVRGLTAADLADAREDREALAALAARQPAATEVDAFAASGALESRNIDPPQGEAPARRGRR